jgi:hypothetical protein
LKRQKEDLARTIHKISEEQEQRVRETSIEQKQLQFRLDNVEGELRDKKKQVELLEEEKKKMTATLAKY